MPELSDDGLAVAVDARAARFTPPAVPPFSGVLRRRRARRRRRLAAGAGVLALVCAAALSVLPGPGAQDRVVPADAPVGAAVFVEVRTRADVRGYVRDRDEPPLLRCLELPGTTGPGVRPRIFPPRYGTRVDAAGLPALERCLGALPNLPDLEVTRTAVTVADPRGATLCRTEPAGPCVDVDADTAAALQEVLTGVLVRADPNIISDCVVQPDEHTVRVTGSSSTLLYVLPSVCGPMRLGPDVFDVGLAVPERVRAAWGRATLAAGAATADVVRFAVDADSPAVQDRTTQCLFVTGAYLDDTSPRTDPPVEAAVLVGLPDREPTLRSCLGDVPGLRVVDD